MKRFNNKEIYTGSPQINLSCFMELEELGRCLKYSDLKKFMVCACLILAGRLFQTTGALLVNESMPGREEGQPSWLKRISASPGLIRMFGKT